MTAFYIFGRFQNKYRLIYIPANFSQGLVKSPVVYAVRDWGKQSAKYAALQTAAKRGTLLNTLFWRKPPL